MNKFLPDENLSRKLVPKLSYLMDIRHVADEHLLQTYDNNIWQFARREGFAIITKDNDFLYLSIAYDCPPKVVKLNCGNKSTTYIFGLIVSHIDTIQGFMLSQELCYLEIS